MSSKDKAQVLFENDYWKAVTSEDVETIQKWSHHTGWCTKNELDARQYVEAERKLVAIYKRYPKSKSRPNFQLAFKFGVCVECKHRTMEKIQYRSLLLIVPELKEPLTDFAATTNPLQGDPEPTMSRNLRRFAAYYYAIPEEPRTFRTPAHGRRAMGVIDELGCEGVGFHISQRTPYRALHKR